MRTEGKKTELVNTKADFDPQSFDSDGVVCRVWDQRDKWVETEDLRRTYF